MLLVTEASTCHLNFIKKTTRNAVSFLLGSTPSLTYDLVTLVLEKSKPVVVVLEDDLEVLVAFYLVTESEKGPIVTFVYVKKDFRYLNILRKAVTYERAIGRYAAIRRNRTKSYFWQARRRKKAKIKRW